MYAFETSTLATKQIFSKSKNGFIVYELKYSPLNDFSKTLHLDFFQDNELKGHVQYVNETPLYCEANSEKYGKSKPAVLYDLLKKLATE